MIPVLRALFPWYMVIATGVAVDAFFYWIFRGAASEQIQIAVGAVAGTLIAVGIVMKVHEVRHPCEVWIPENRASVIRAAKALGFCAGALAASDPIIRHTQLHKYFDHTFTGIFFAPAFAIVAGVFARIAKVSTSEKGN